MATFTFASLDITTTGGRGLFASGGTVNIGGTSNTIDVTGFTGIDVTSTSIGTGWTFSGLTASGGPNGIVLSSTGTGSFDVTGTGATDGSGEPFRTRPALL